MAHSSAGELVDIVDADDRVLRQATRAEMRAGRLRHRATYLLVFNSRGELFVHQRTASKDVYPAYWDVAVGGVVGAGESYDDGARRELAEEIGVRDAAPEPLFGFAWEDAGNQVHGRVYRVVTDAPLRLQAEEIQHGEWLLPAAVDARIARDPFCPDGVLVWRRYVAGQVSR
ncbi:MAG: NUDIX domain-containing protein [Deltaproteobacteria bacterium]|nr:NUDIX domain-containing protein [Deltaproteobacteria bacterium]